MYNNFDYGYDYGYDIANTSNTGTWIGVAFIIAIVCGICLYFTVFSDNNASKYKGFMAKLYEFVKFKKMYITTVLKVSYLVMAIFITLASFALISVSFLSFICMLVFGNLGLRLVYEFALVLLSIHENTSEINKKLKK